MRWCDVVVSVVGCLLVSTYTVANPMDRAPKQTWQQRVRALFSQRTLATTSQGEPLSQEWKKVAAHPRLSGIDPVSVNKKKLLAAHARYKDGNREVPAFVKCSLWTNNAKNENAIFDVIDRRLKNPKFQITDDQLHFIRRLDQFKAGPYKCIVLTHAGKWDLYRYILTIQLLHPNDLPTIMLSLAKQLFAGVLDLHRLGIAHLDLKSDNVMIDTAKDFYNPKLNIIDFDLSIAFLLDDNSVGISGVDIIQKQLDMGTPFTGTAGFYPPEQSVFPVISLTKSDVWSAAMTLLTPLFGRLLFCADYVEVDDHSRNQCRDEMKAYYEKNLKEKLSLGERASAPSTPPSAHRVEPGVHPVPPSAPPSAPPALPGANSVKLLTEWVPVLQDMLTVNPVGRPSMDQVYSRLPRPSTGL